MHVCFVINTLFEITRVRFIMILIIFLLIVLLCTIVTIMRSGKPLKHIMAEVKLEAVINMLGGRGMIEDVIMKDKNKTGRYGYNKTIHNVSLLYVFV